MDSFFDTEKKIGDYIVRNPTKVVDMTVGELADVYKRQESVYDAAGNMLVKINHMVTPKRAELIVKKGVDANGVPFTVKDDLSLIHI